MYLDAIDLQNGIDNISKDDLIDKNSKLFRQINVILSLAEHRDGGIDGLSELDSEILNVMLLKCGLGDGKQKKLDFGSECIAGLLNIIGPVKCELQDYIGSLRSLSLQS